MRYPPVRYVEIGSTTALELHLMDGTSRTVTFGGAKARSDALRAGRAELDAAAILRGRAPDGSVLVSVPAARPASELLRETFEVANTACYDPREMQRIRIATARAVAAAMRRAPR